MAAASTAASNDAVHAKVEALEAELDHLSLITEAMWELLRTESVGVDQLRAKIAEIDAADGNADGMRTARPVRCRACEAMVEAGRSACAFCGAELPAEDAPTPWR